MRGLHTLRAAHPAPSRRRRGARSIVIAMLVVLHGAPPFARGDPARGSASAQADPTYAADLIARAHTQQIADSPGWRRLLH